MRGGTLSLLLFCSLHYYNTPTPKMKEKHVTPYFYVFWELASSFDDAYHTLIILLWMIPELSCHAKKNSD